MRRNLRRLSLFCFAGLIAASSSGIRVMKPGRNPGRRTRIHQIKPPDPKQIAAHQKDLMNTGIELTAPSTQSDLPAFRITRPDGTVPPEMDDGWNRIARPEASGSSIPTDGAVRERIPAPPGDYSIRFSHPVSAVNLLEYTADLTWTQSVRVRRGRMTEAPIHLPAITAADVAHAHIQIDGPSAKFNILTLEPIPHDRNSDAGSSRWEFVAPPYGWDPNLRVALLKGRYRAILSASAGSFAALRYEIPQPLEIVGDAVVLIHAPEFHRLQARLTDSKGAPLVGVPLMFQGTGDTEIMADSGSGTIDVRLPRGRYTVRVVVWQDKGQKNLVLDRGLDMDRDQDRSWKAPVKTLDFGALLNGSR